ncbi:MAG: exodeoxyribonuclease VII large subunit [Bacilli bacterium]
MDIKYYSITALNKAIKNMFDREPALTNIYIKGEISNFKHHTRGHLYFTLKDETSRISAVMFSSAASKITFVPEDGMNVLVSGRVTVYEANGGYQIYVETMELDGIGNLYLEYEKLKKKLASEGLFDDIYKKKIPRYPRKIGIITASTGAAIRDILSTIKRRYPICETILFPSLVQGEGAKESIVRQLERAQEFDLDVIICGRGGGSIEDLWAFNEEIVARAIFNSRIPVISAVGHEVDFTIADFVADLRAPTPTGAAEMAVPNLFDINNLINQYQIRLKENLNNLINKNRNKLENLTNSFVLKNPMSMYEVKEQKLDSYIDLLNKFISNKLNQYQIRLSTIKSNYILNNPISMFDEQKHRYSLILKTMELVNPLNILSKGYSLVKVNDRIIKSYKDIDLNTNVNVKLHEGSFVAKVIEKSDK